MLSELRIRDFAIIGELSLEFAPGMNVLTGETGAGKSILVDALGLALGDRSHPEMVRTGAGEALVEAVFTCAGQSWGDFLSERGIAPDEDGLLVVRRRVPREGRQQAHVNGGVVPLGLLSEIGARLVDIHGQHQHQTLLRIANHLEILDDYGGLGPLRAGFSEVFARLAALKARMARAALDEREREQRRDFLRFQVREIEASGLAPGEDVELEQRRGVLVNAENLSRLAGEALGFLYEGENAAAGQVDAAADRVEELARHLPEIRETVAELRGSAAVLKEAAGTLERLAGSLEYDPGEHDLIEERLSAIARLKRKHGSDVDGILATLESLRSELAELAEEETASADWVREKGRLAAELGEAGRRLSEGRRETARRIEKEVTANLADLGMGKARFAVDLRPRAAPDGEVEVDGVRYDPWEGGLEEVEFLLASNPGEDLKGLARVASGGELSRIMLAIKASLARVDRVETLIFDEIDTGIGGAVARTVGRTLKALSVERQVVCVTHLPQIASLADEHVVVCKETGTISTTVTARRVRGNERVRELARMVAGETVTEAAERHARELMEG